MCPLWNDLIPSTIYVPSEIPFMSVSNADPTRSSSSSFSSLRGRLLAGPLELATLAPWRTREEISSWKHSRSDKARGPRVRCKTS